MRRSSRRARSLSLLIGASVGAALASGLAVGAVGGPGADRLTGSSASETLVGRGGDDVLRGLAGNDRLRGDEGNDVLIGGTGQDRLQGGPGDDRMIGGPDLDTFDGGAGDDLIGAADGLAELVVCGPGEDAAVADTHDAVDASCERVLRRPPGAAHVLWSELFPGDLAIARATTEGRRVDPDFIVVPERGRWDPFRRQPLMDVAVGGRRLFSTNFQRGRIVGNDLNGRNQNDRLVRDLGALRIVGSTATDDRVFWTNTLERRIGRANADGSGRDESFIRLSHVPFDVANDGEFLYWTTSRGTIGRARLDGSDVDERFIELGGFIIPEVAQGIDVYNGYIYWASPSRSAIGRARVDGSGIERRFVPTGLGVFGIAADSRHVFWTDTLAGTIGRANVDGSNPDGRFIRREVELPYLASVERVARGVLYPRLRDFGARQVGTGPSASQSFEITSAGNAPLQLGSVAMRGPNAGDFTVTADSCSNATLGPDATCTVSVAFAPTAAGGRAARVRVPTNDPDAPLLTGRVIGVGTVPEATIEPPTKDYGSREVGGGPSAPTTFTVTSTGSATFTLGQVALEGDDATSFAVTADTCSNATLAPLATCDVDVVFDPTSADGKLASLSVPGSSQGAPSLSASLEGIGVSAAASLVPKLVRFGDREVGDGPSDPQQLTLESVGGAPLDVTRVELSGADATSYRISSDLCSGRSLAPGATCAIEVAFQPLSEGAKDASVDVVADDPGLSTPAAQSTLAGTGTVAPSPPAPPPQPVPTPLPSPIIAGCAITGLDVSGQTSRNVNGVRQPFVTRAYNGSMVVAGTSTCLPGQGVSLWGPKLKRRSGSRLLERSRRSQIEIVARATVQADGSFRLPTDTRPPGQYFVAIDGTEPLAGSPLWLQIEPVLKAVPRGSSRVVAYAGPPVATAGAKVTLERRVGAGWRSVSSARVSARARARLATKGASGALRIRITPTSGQRSTQTSLSTQASLITQETAPVR